jgi:hypothetical protein
MEEEQKLSIRTNFLESLKDKFLLKEEDEIIMTPPEVETEIEIEFYCHGKKIKNKEVSLISALEVEELKEEPK